MPGDNTVDLFSSTADSKLSLCSFTDDSLGPVSGTKIRLLGELKIYVPYEQVHQLAKHSALFHQ